MPYCTKCGQSVSDTSKFCTKCGHPLIKSGLQKSESVPVGQKDGQIGTQQQEVKENQNTEPSIPVIINDSTEQEISTQAKKWPILGNKKRRLLFTLIISSISILILFYFLFFQKDVNKNIINEIASNDSSEQKLSNDTAVLISIPVNDSFNTSSVDEQLKFKINDTSMTLGPQDKLVSNTKDTSSKKLISNFPNPSNEGENKGPNDFIYLTVGQIKRDLINKPLCEGLTYTGEDQKLIVIGGLPDNIYQRKLDLLGSVTIRILFKEEIENKSCTLEVFYKKREKKFDLITYAEK